MEYTGGSWVSLGGLSSGAEVIAIDPSGIPYVIVNMDTVQKYVGGSWQVVGGTIDYASTLAIDPSGTPFVVCGNLVMGLR
jgi:hypothetical protein